MAAPNCRGTDERSKPRKDRQGVGRGWGRRSYGDPLQPADGPTEYMRCPDDCMCSTATLARAQLVNVTADYRRTRPAPTGGGATISISSTSRLDHVGQPFV